MREEMKNSHALEKSQRGIREHDVQLCQQNFPIILVWNVSNIEQSGKTCLEHPLCPPSRFYL